MTLRRLGYVYLRYVRYLPYLTTLRYLTEVPYLTLLYVSQATVQILLAGLRSVYGGALNDNGVFIRKQLFVSWSRTSGSTADNRLRASILLCCEVARSLRA